MKCMKEPFERCLNIVKNFWIHISEDTNFQQTVSGQWHVYTYIRCRTRAMEEYHNKVLQELCWHSIFTTMESWMLDKLIRTTLYCWGNVSLLTCSGSSKLFSSSGWSPVIWYKTAPMPGPKLWSLSPDNESFTLCCDVAKLTTFTTQYSKYVSHIQMWVYRAQDSACCDSSTVFPPLLLNPG